MFDLYIGNNLIVRLSSTLHLRYHTPDKSGNTAWEIINSETNQVVDSYKPKSIKKTKPCTSYKGSWAWEMAGGCHVA